jgi:hypothetical protein
VGGHGDRAKDGVVLLRTCGDHAAQLGKNDLGSIRALNHLV